MYFKKILTSFKTENHSYRIVDSDPRFDNAEKVPFPAGGATRPILVDDISYRTTFLR